MNKILQYKYQIILSLVFILLRGISFLIRDSALVENLIAGLLVGSFIIVCYKKLNLAWVILVLEILLGGSAHFFELQGLILRTWFLGIFAFFWLFQIIFKKRKLVFPSKKVLISLIVFGLFLLFSIINGLVQNHSILFVIQDTILYLFILLLFPALTNENKFQSIYKIAVEVFIFCSAIFSVLTFILYSSGLYVLNDPFYHWFRNIAAGKITDLGLNFFRIVLPEHLLFVPIILVLLSYLLGNFKNKKMWFLLVLSLIVILLNFTRIYFVSLVVGGVVLLYHTSWKKWLTVMTLTAILSMIIFSGFNLIASRGQSFGLELLGVKASGISRPSSDLSGAIRLALLPDIMQKIKNRPLLGNGLGTTVTFFSPVTKTYETRTQFDWGYLEMIAELGFVGTFVYLILLILIIVNFGKTSGASKENNYFARGLLAGAVALFVINITTPALFQGFGVIYFAFLAVFTKYSWLTK